VAAKFEIMKTETSIVGPRGLTHYLVPTRVGSSGSNYHPVGTTQLQIKDQM